MVLEHKQFTKANMKWHFNPIFRMKRETSSEFNRPTQSIDIIQRINNDIRSYFVKALRFSGHKLCETVFFTFNNRVL